MMKTVLVLTILTGTLFGASGCAQKQGMLSGKSSKRDSVATQGIQFDLARLSEKQGKLQQAQEMYLSLLKEHPNDARVLHRLGVVAAKLDQGEQSTHYFMRALRSEPHNSEILTDLGYALYLQNDLSGAETALKQAQQEDATNTRAVNNLAMVMGAQGRTDDSYALFRQVVNEAEATSNLAYIQAQSGQIERATQSYSQALSLDHDLEKASVALLQIADQKYLAERRGRAEATRSTARVAPPAAEVVEVDDSVPVFAEDAPAIRTISRESVDEPASTAVHPESEPTGNWYDDQKVSTADQSLPLIVPGVKNKLHQD